MRTPQLHHTSLIISSRYVIKRHGCNNPILKAPSAIIGNHGFQHESTWSFRSKNTNTHLSLSISLCPWDNRNLCPLPGSTQYLDQLFGLQLLQCIFIHDLVCTVVNTTQPRKSISAFTTTFYYCNTGNLNRSHNILFAAVTLI